MGGMGDHKGPTTTTNNNNNNNNDDNDNDNDNNNKKIQMGIYSNINWDITGMQL